MTRRRSRPPCPHADGDRPYPVWPEPGWPLGADPDLDEALGRLENALTACDEVLNSAISELTTADVAKALRSVPVQKRDAVLRPIGLMIKPRQVSHKLCQDIRTLMLRADDHATRHAATALTWSVTLDVGQATFADEQVDQPHLPDPVQKWGPALCRLAVWSHGLASVRDARIWLWASQQPWFRFAGVSDEQIKVIVSAAEDVVELSSTFTSHGPTDDAESVDEIEVDDVGDVDDTVGGNSVHRVDGATTAGEESPVLSAAPQDLVTAVEVLDIQLTAGLSAARQVVQRLSEKRPPSHDDVAILVGARESFDAVVSSLAAAGAQLADDTMAALREAVEQVTAQAGDKSVRKLLELVCALVGPQDQAMLLSQLTHVQDEARDLLTISPWDSFARERAATLGLLVEMATPGRDAESQMALVAQWSQARPELSFLAVQAQRLTFPEVVAGTIKGDTEAPASAAPPGTPDSPPSAAGTEPGSAAVITIVASAQAPGEAEQGTVETADEHLLSKAPSIAPAMDDTVEPVADEPRAVPHRVTVATSSLVAEPESESVSGARATQAIAQLVGAQRFGLAAAIVERAIGWSAPFSPGVLRIAALADAVRHHNGAVADALRGELDHLDAGTFAADQPSLLLVVPALLRTALITGEPTAGALLSELAARVESNLSKVADEVGRRALRGVLIERQALSVLADVTEAERGMHAISESARLVRTRHRTLRFNRATDISRIWLGSQGLLGRPLTIVERNDTGEVDNVAAAIDDLTTASFVKSELETIDRRLRGPSSKPLEGAGKHDLLNLVQESLKPLADWVNAVRSLNDRNARTQHWSTGEVADMRSAVLKCRVGVTAALTDFTSHDDSLTAAAAQASAASLAMTFDLLQGSYALPAREPRPALVLTAELLKVPGVRIDVGLEQMMLPDDATIDELLAAVDRTWEQALSAQVDSENFEAAHFLLDADKLKQLPFVDGQLDGMKQQASKVEADETRVRAELINEYGLLETALRRGRVNNEISDEQYGELTGLLMDARRLCDSPHLAIARQTLHRIVDLLPAYRAEANERLTVRLERLKSDGRVDEDTRARITGLIEGGQLSTAEELIYFLEIDEDVPEVHESEDLKAFFPAVPDALPGGVSPDLVMLVNRRGVVENCPELNFTELSPDMAEMASDALNNWRQLTHVDPAARTNVSEADRLVPALRMIGLETGRVKKLPDWPRSHDRRFVEVDVKNIIGKGLVPAFGSKLGGRLRVLLAWGQPSAKLLMSWADDDPSGEALLIAHLGTMSAHTRRDLAAEASRRSASIVVLDDAALVYLAAHGNRQMTATMNVLLPFSSINPYIRQKRSVVAPEMFYGRDQERRSVLDPDGTQLVFGGRSLGKSALLHSAAEQFLDQSKTAGERVALYLDLKEVGIRANSPINQEAIWDALLDALTRCAVLPVPGRAAHQKPAYERVRSGVRAWLDADSQRRLLVLLDEADQFFEAEVPHFLETTRLKSLGQESNGRVKVVFAGLHSVQRYAKRARNAPFGHMAQRPTVIGPLKPQHAANLLTRPMAALGFEFEDEDLVNRILGYCSYQPFLLQIFANRLIEAMHTKRRAGEANAGEPPYIISQSDVEAVEAQADLRDEISAAFHDTLHLDPRYGVIAHVLANHAHEVGLDARLTDRQLREECLSYWHKGFARLDAEGFRAYLQEMAGLGVLAPNNDGRGWHLRSANVLNMIGTRDRVEAHLVTAAEESVHDDFLALESRHELPGGRRSPLTATQIDDVLGERNNQVRVVLGSPATGIELVREAVETAANVGDRFQLPQIGSRRDFKEQLVAGKPGEWRVVLDDLVKVAPNEAACLEALEMAQTLLPTAPGVTRSAVIVAGPAQMALWRQIFAQTSGMIPRRPGLLPVETITLRRYDMTTLRVWSLETNLFTSEERRAQLLRVTGGWPLLVERAARLVKGETSADGPTGVDEPEALRRLTAELNTPAGAAKLVSGVGLSDQQLSRAYEGVLEIVDTGSLTRADLEVAVELAADEPTTTVECLIALQVFNIDNEGGFTPEPLLRACWPSRS